MRNLQKAGGAASLLNAAIAVANIAVVFGMLGAEIAADPVRVADLVTTRPAPLLLLECFKIGSALAALVTVLALHQRLHWSGWQWAKGAALAGVLSAVLLLTAGVVGAIAIAFAHSSDRAGQSAGAPVYVTLNATIYRLGLAAVFANGIWYLLLSGAAIRLGLLPRVVCSLGLLLGGASLIAFVLPPVAVLVLVLSLVWATWLGVLLLRDPAPRPRSAVVGSHYIEPDPS